MPETGGMSDYWLNIDPERMERYETMYRWNPASEPFYTPAQIGQGHVVGDFGCGPGHAAIEFANRVGPSGHVHAFDINSEFVRRAREKADANNFGDRITVHLLEDHRLPLPDSETDRMIARNTIIYVPDPESTFSEFRRVLKPGGIAHCIEGDWRLTAVEPVVRSGGLDCRVITHASRRSGCRSGKPARKKCAGGRPSALAHLGVGRRQGTSLILR